jgi:SAM-dependent methyltransferase
MFCPCCGGHFRTFLPSARGKRPNTMCPRCLSLERHRLYWMFLKDRTNFFTLGLKVLHFAPELCLYAAFRKQANLDYVPADLNSPLAMQTIDITQIPYPDNTFDVILCSHVLEHVSEDRQAIREMFRVLKPGGWGIVQPPIDTGRTATLEDPAIVSPEDRQRFYGHDDHVRLYGLDYKDRLEEAGFHVNVDYYVQTLDPGIVEACALPANEAIYFCSKSED